MKTKEVKKFIVVASIILLIHKNISVASGYISTILTNI